MVLDKAWQQFAIENKVPVTQLYVDEALELLLGESAGERNRSGQYPKKSINGKALARLADIAELVNGGAEE